MKSEESSSILRYNKTSFQEIIFHDQTKNYPKIHLPTYKPNMLPLNWPHYFYKYHFTTHRTLNYPTHTFHYTPLLSFFASIFIIHSNQILKRHPPPNPSHTEWHPPPNPMRCVGSRRSLEIPPTKIIISRTQLSSAKLNNYKYEKPIFHCKSCYLARGATPLALKTQTSWESLSREKKRKSQARYLAAPRHELTHDALAIISRLEMIVACQIGLVQPTFPSSQFSKNPKFKVQCKLTTIPSHHHQIYFPTPLNPMLPSEKNRRSQNKLKSFTKHNFTIININIIYKFPNQTKKNYIKI